MYIGAFGGPEKAKQALGKVNVIRFFAKEYTESHPHKGGKGNGGKGKAKGTSPPFRY